MSELYEDLERALNIKLLSAREWKIISMRHGFNKNKIHTFKQIAEEFPISSARVNAIYRQAIWKMQMEFQTGYWEGSEYNK